MSTTESDALPAAGARRPLARSRARRRSGRTGARLLALLSLVAAVAATAWVVGGAFRDDELPPVAAATAESWARTGELSDALRELRPGASPAAARPFAQPALKAVVRAQKRVAALDLPASQTPLRGRVLDALRADRRWIDAVGSVLARPESPRRAQLARLAKEAATSTALLRADLPAAVGTVGGTGRLLSALRGA